MPNKTAHEKNEFVFALHYYSSMKLVEERKVQLSAFVALVVDGGKRSASRIGSFIRRRKTPGYPLDTRLGENRSQFGCCEEKKIYAPAGIRTPVHCP